MPLSTKTHWSQNVFLGFIPHLPVGLVNDHNSEEPEEVANTQDPLVLWTKTNEAGVGRKGIVVHIVAVEKIGHILNASHRVVLYKVAEIDNSLLESVSVQLIKRRVRRPEEWE